MHMFLALIGRFVPVAHAQTLNNAGGGPGVSTMWSTICNTIPCATTAGPGGRSLILALSKAVIAFLFPLISVVAVCLVIYAGILIASSNGSEEKISEAKKIILYAALGVILSLMTTVIITYVVSYLQTILS
jgi:hypothetical protein